MKAGDQFFSVGVRPEPATWVDGPPKVIEWRIYSYEVLNTIGRANSSLKTLRVHRLDDHAILTLRGIDPATLARIPEEAIARHRESIADALKRSEEQVERYADALRRFQGWAAGATT